MRVPALSARLSQISQGLVNSQSVLFNGRALPRAVHLAQKFIGQMRSTLVIVRLEDQRHAQPRRR